MTAEITYESDELTAEVPGFEGTDFGQLTLLRANPNNLLFHNESDEEARLVFELQPEVDADGVPTGPERVCTTLVEPGGSTFMTVIVTRPSFAVDEPFAFTVAGSDASLEVVVP